MIFGINANLAVMASPFLPMVAENFPRFRNIFLKDEEDAEDPYDGDLYVYTRMGGGNRECYCEEEGCDCSSCGCGACEADRIEGLPNCIARDDDDFDYTYCTFVFKVLEENRNDFLCLKEGRFSDLSDWYWETLANQFKGRENIEEFISKTREMARTATPNQSEAE